MTYDVISYNGEMEILKLRLRMLYDHVDKFVIVEAKTTFSGNKKPLYFSKHENSFEPWWDKIEYFVIDEDYSEEERELARTSPNTVGAKHWQNEFLQKESIKKALWKVQDEDTVYIGDCDEIWDYRYAVKGNQKLLLRVYAYYLNNSSSEVFWGTLAGKWGDIKGSVLNHLRSDVSIRAMEYGGWHFTSMGGFKEVQRKLNDSYTTQSYNTYEVQKNLGARLEKGIDYLGRDFKFKLDERHWPEHLKVNRAMYRKLIKDYEPSTKNHF